MRIKEPYTSTGPFSRAAVIVVPSGGTVNLFAGVSRLSGEARRLKVDGTPMPPRPSFGRSLATDGALAPYLFA
jgi:hypothetical protein